MRVTCLSMHYNFLHLNTYAFLGCMVPSSTMGESLKNNKPCLMPVFEVTLLAKLDFVVSNNYFHTHLKKP